MEFYEIWTAGMLGAILLVGVGIELNLKGIGKSLVGIELLLERMKDKMEDNL